MTYDPMEVEEYRCLTIQIQADLQRVFQTLSFIAIASAAIIGYGFTSGNPFVFLAPFLILIPGSFLMYSYTDEVIFSGAYIKTKIEDKNPGIRWESMLWKCRQMSELKCKKDNGKKGIGYMCRTANAGSKGYVMILSGFAVLYVSLFIYSYQRFDPIMVVAIVFLLSLQFWINIKHLMLCSPQGERKYMELFAQPDYREVFAPFERKEKEVCSTGTTASQQISSTAGGAPPHESTAPSR